MREQAVTLSYDDLARYPDEHMNKPVRLRGEIIQQVDDTTFRISITRGSYGIWTDPVLVELKGDARSARLLEEDIVEFVGIAKGEYTYTAVLGNKITVPRIHAYEISVQ